MCIRDSIEGRPMYDSLLDKSATDEDLEMIGSIIRRLHELGFSHGDLTTHNIMVDKDRKISLLDFGLSRISAELEHFGQDLQVLNECLSASHSEFEGAIERVMSGYRDASNSDFKPNAEAVISRFNDIRNRVRYLG